MKVILLQNIKGFGRIGDIKNVSDGYARNMLFPKKLAKVATDTSVKEAENLQKKREVVGLMEKEAAQKAAAALVNTSAVFTKKASSTGTLFSSLTKAEIAKELSKIAGVFMNAEVIDLGDAGEHIKHTGEYQVQVHLGEDLDCDVKISVQGN